MKGFRAGSGQAAAGLEGWAGCLFLFFFCGGVGIVSAAASKWMKKSLKKWAGLVLGGQKWCKDHFFFLL